MLGTGGDRAKQCFYFQDFKSSGDSIQRQPQHREELRAVTEGPGDKRRGRFDLGVSGACVQEESLHEAICV